MKPEFALPVTQTQCVCGRVIYLSRDLLDFPGQLLRCPNCGEEKRVWQWAARANRLEDRK